MVEMTPDQPKPGAPNEPLEPHGVGADPDEVFTVFDVKCSIGDVFDHCRECHGSRVLIKIKDDGGAVIRNFHRPDCGIWR